MFNKCFNNILDNSLCVFLYHEVSDCPSEFNKTFDLNVPPSIFKKQIEVICNHFNVITPAQLISGDFKIPAALITFDDGMAGYFENAVPILESLKCPSLICMNMAPVDGEVFWPGLITYLTSYDIGFQRVLKDHFQGSIPSDSFLEVTQEMVERYLDRKDRSEIYDNVGNFCGEFATRDHLSEIAENKYVYLGNHLYNHYNAVMLSNDELRAAFLRNEAELERYPNSVKVFSYPFGQPNSCYNDRTNSLIFDLGARIIFSAYPSLNFKKKSTLLHRIPMNDNVCSEEDVKFASIRNILGSSVKRRDMSKILNHLRYIWK